MTRSFANVHDVGSEAPTDENADCSGERQRNSPQRRTHYTRSYRRNEIASSPMVLLLRHPSASVASESVASVSACRRRFGRAEEFGAVVAGRITGELTVDPRERRIACDVVVSLVRLQLDLNDVTHAACGVQRPISPRRRDQLILAAVDDQDVGAVAGTRGSDIALKACPQDIGSRGFAGFRSSSDSCFASFIAGRCRGALALQQGVPVPWRIRFGSRRA